jgi:hypothetical protein
MIPRHDGSTRFLPFLFLFHSFFLSFFLSYIPYPMYTIAGDYFIVAVFLLLQTFLLLFL